MTPATQDDFPKGHPARFDYDPQSPEAIEWKRKNVHQLGQRDFPVDHPKAADTAGNENSLEWRAGEDPRNPHIQPFSGRTPLQVEGLRELSVVASNPPQAPLALLPVDVAVAYVALAAERKRLGVDTLTHEQHTEVLRKLQQPPSK